MGVISITDCTVENLRNYSNASCTFHDLTVLVGENNEGKSSLVKMLDFLVNKADDDLLSGKRKMNYEEEAFLMPANNTRHKARRFSITLKFNDQRKARPYLPNHMLVRLRMSVSASSKTIRLNLGKPKSHEKHDAKALKLRHELQNSLRVILIHAIRDASSSRFAERIANHVDATITEKMSFQGRGGSSKEYREANSAIRSLTKIVTLNKKAFEKASEVPLLGRMVKDTAVKFNGDINDVLRWIKEGLHLAISTGTHDERMVRATEVGNGLQSIIDIALTLSGIEDDDQQKDLFLIVEEPEVFLHPSAQRELIIALQENAKRDGRQIVVTTHSPTILDEVYFGDIVLVRNQRFFQHNSESQRDAINTCLVNPTSAEVLFSTVVLLVEGPGDKAFFEVLIKRLRRLPEAKDITKLTVQDVGGKERFAPWIKMFDSFKTSSYKPINWLCIADADFAQKDSGRTIMKTFSELNIKPSQEISNEIVAFGNMPFTPDKTQEREVAIKQLNDKLLEYGFQLFSVDLEWAILSHINGPILKQIAKTLKDGRDDAKLETDKIAIAKKLGSKVGGKASDEGIKQPWIRAEIAKWAEFKDLGQEIKDVIIRAISLLYVGDTKKAETVWKAAVEKNPTL